MVLACCWYPVDSALFCTAGNDKRLRLFSTDCMQQVTRSRGELPLRDCHWGFAEQGGGAVALALDSQGVGLFDPRTGSVAQHLRRGQTHFRCVRWRTPTGPYLYAGTAEGTVLLYDLRTG